MVKVRRGKKPEATVDPAPLAEAEPLVLDDLPAPEETPAPDEPAPPDGGAAMEATPHTEAPQPPSWEPPAATGGNQRRSSSAPGAKALFSRMFGDVGEQSAAERDRQAAEEFQQVLAPAMDLLRASVPEASSPEEAARILEQSQGELIPDPDGGAFVRGDAFNTDARVYYRLLRRDYEKTPRPSQKRGASPHLHRVYGKLTGTKGW